MATRYAFFGSWGGQNTNAQAIGERLEELIEQHGEHLTADEIVADAGHRDSPLRDLFTWDENEAADKCRRREAKNLLKTLRVDNGKGKRATQAFVYVKHPAFGGKRVILTMRSAMARTEFRDQVVEKALHSLQRWAKYYGSHVAMKPVAQDIKRLRARIESQLMAGV